MALTLYYHPLASFCHKVLIALYENETPFSPQIVDLLDEEVRAKYLEIWPVGKMPVLLDDSSGRAIPETTIVIEYLEQHYPGSQQLLPTTPDERLEARLWDRFFDLYVQTPLQKIVIDRLRKDGEHDPRGVEDAKGMLATAYDTMERQLADKTWAIGETFSIADCAAAPALFYAGIVAPFAETHPNTASYFERLLERPSFQRVLAEAKPYFHMFPFMEKMPARFLA